MCGITGYINTTNVSIKDTNSILNMLHIQRHRGPDDSGIFAFSLSSGNALELTAEKAEKIEGNFEGIIGFNRLSILDLSINGHQPMVSPDNKVLLALNGEIYNAFDYKNELKTWGYKFKSTTDTEIVLALYLKYGLEGMLSHLNGMFAIVIVDLRKNEILIARDRFGIKPMYYISNNDTFAFSSELKSFMYIDNFVFNLFEDQIDEYLLFRNNLNGTLFKDIQSLGQGHYLTFSHDKGLVRKRYFDANNYSRAIGSNGSIDKYIAKLEEWLSKSVKSQLMSDVKLGCQLSGGIDSSLVTWLANRNSERGSFEGVSIIFKDQRFSEEKYIDKVTECLSTPVHKFLLDSDYYLDNLENAAWHLESPINHPNSVAIYKLSQRAKEYVTVLLSGEGADEVFGGYGRFYDICYPFRMKRIFHEIKKNLQTPFATLDYFNLENRAVMATAFTPPFTAKRLWKGFRMDRATIDRISLYKSLSGSIFDRQVKYEMNSYLPDLLIRQDKMSMAHSIENRVPFLDNELVENSFSIPEKYLLLEKSPEGKNTEKYLLKRMVAGVFSSDFAFRDKMGFGIPLREFFLNKKFTEYMHYKILPGIRIRGLFNYKLVYGWFSDIRKLGYSELEALWVIVSFELWASVFLDNKYENSNTR
jgi:asparagine synthase (glutamine-hydrolysing)